MFPLAQQYILPSTHKCNACRGTSEDAHLLYVQKQHANKDARESQQAERLVEEPSIKWVTISFGRSPPFSNLAQSHSTIRFHKKAHQDSSSSLPVSNNFTRYHHHQILHNNGFLFVDWLIRWVASGESAFPMANTLCVM